MLIGSKAYSQDFNSILVSIFQEKENSSEHFFLPESQKSKGVVREGSSGVLHILPDGCDADEINNDKECFIPYRCCIIRWID